MLNSAKKKSIVIVAAMVVAWVVFVIVGMQMRPKQADPVREILAQFEMAEKALQNEDLPTLQTLINFETFSRDISSQIVSVPDDQAQMARAIQNNVADTLVADFEALMRSGGGAPVEGTLLGQVYKSFVGASPEGLHMTGVSVTEVAGNTATLGTLWHREDVDVAFPLTLHLAVENNLWRFKGISGVTEAFAMIGEKEQDVRLSQNEMIAAKMAAAITLQEVKLAAPSVKKGEKESLLVFMSLKNTSGKDVASYNVAALVKDKEGMVLMSIPLYELDSLAAGDVLEKTWPAPLGEDTVEDALTGVPVEEAVVELIVNEITFADGEVLAPIPDAIED